MSENSEPQRSSSKLGRLFGRSKKSLKVDKSASMPSLDVESIHDDNANPMTEKFQDDDLEVDLEKYTDNLMIFEDENGLRYLQGEKGDVGEKGDQGEKGDVGEKGDQGERGDTGEPGYPGEKGYEGDQGEKGDKGDRGEDAEQGEQGEKGDPGQKGDQGERGEQGLQGERGIPGVSGSTGEKGDKGDTGEKGDRGDPGEKGERGDPGKKGEKGDRGDPGEKGEKGEIGEKGDRGDPGEKGEKGETGQKGEKGEKGEQGEKGDSGNAGEKGDTGTTGNAGEKGDKGDMGKQGNPGPNIIANICYPPEPGIGRQTSIDVSSNNIITLPANPQYIIIAPPNPNIEGTAEFAGSILTFTPCPRFSGTAVFGYSVTDVSGTTVSAIVKVNVDLSYPQSALDQPKLWFANGTNVLRRFNMPGSNASSSSISDEGLLTLPGQTTTAGMIAANKSDGVLYYCAPGTTIINIWDPVNPTQTAILEDVTSLGVSMISSLGYDNVNNLLYVGVSNTNSILQIATQPYHRYPTISQFYTASILQFPNIVPVSGVQSIAVEPETGFLLVTNGNNLRKLNPANGSQIATVSLGSVSTGLLSYGNNGKLYLIIDIGSSPRNIYQVNTSTLGLVHLGNVNANVTQLTEPLYNL